MKWNYLKNSDYTKWYSDIIVKCEDGEVLKTGYSSQSKTKMKRLLLLKASPLWKMMMNLGMKTRSLI